MTNMMYSKIGSYHEKSGLENQDYLEYENTSDYIFSLLSDGATGCKRGKQGAQLAAQAIREILEKEGIRFFQLQSTYPRKMASLMVDHILFTIEKEKEADIPISEYGSTFIYSIYDKRNSMLYLGSLGDSVAYAVGPSKCIRINTPFHVLTTDTNAKDALRFFCLDNPSESLRNFHSILFSSDGFWNEMNRSAELKDYIKCGNYTAITDYFEYHPTMDDASMLQFELKVG